MDDIMNSHFKKEYGEAEVKKLEQQVDRLESIKELRSKISPTPWIYESKPVYDGIDLKERWIKGPTLRSNFPDDTPEGQTANADHEFIAASPEIVEYLLQEVESLQYKYDKYRETARIGYDEDRMSTISEELDFLRNHYRQSFSFMVALLQKNGGKLEIPWNDIAVVPHPDIVEIVKYEDIKNGSWVYELRPKHTL